MVCFDYQDRDSTTTRNNVLEPIEAVLTCFYVAEVLIKAIAMGLFRHQRSYLRSGWNIIDLAVAIFGYGGAFRTR